jgi:hypothetical protein
MGKVLALSSRVWQSRVRSLSRKISFGSCNNILNRTYRQTTKNSKASIAELAQSDWWWKKVATNAMILEKKVDRQDPPPQAKLCA